MAVVLNSLVVTPGTVSAANNDVTITLHFNGRIENAADNSVHMTAVIGDPNVTLIQAGQAVSGIEWEQMFTTSNDDYTKIITIRITPPQQISVCFIDIVAKAATGNTDVKNSHFQFTP